MSDLKPHDLWQQEWSEPFVGNYEAFIDVHELYALFTDHKELQSQIDQLKTQLSGITQYGSVDAAEKIDRLTKERDEARDTARYWRDDVCQGTFKFPWENKTDE